jgi:sodium/bile acid cotransporter 7
MMTPIRKKVSLSFLCFLCTFAHRQTVAFKTLTPKAHRLSVDNVPPNHKKFIVDDNRKNDDAGNSYLHMTALDLAGDGDNEISSLSQRISQATAKVSAFVEKNFFLLGMVVAVAMARIIPSLGKNSGILKPELFIGKFGVTLIFLFSGLSLELSELKTAATNIKANAAIQAVSFGAWPFLVGVPLTKFLRAFLPNLLPPALIDGLLVLTCLPTTVNMCIFLTSAAGGNVASSLCNAVIGNMAGIFLTPALLLRFFGTEIHLPFADMVIKLCNKVLVPVGIGQLLRKTPAKEIYTKNSKKFKRLQELILLGIVWNAFCNAFTKGMGLELRHGLALLALIPTLHVGSLFILQKFFELPFFNFDRSQIVASVYCASHKTLAFGLPLINTIFEGNPNLASYCAPIMFIHPLQLVLGSLAVPKFSKYIEEEQKQQ